MPCWRVPNPITPYSHRFPVDLASLPFTVARVHIQQPVSASSRSFGQNRSNCPRSITLYQLLWYFEKCIQVARCREVIPADFGFNGEHWPIYLGRNLLDCLMDHGAESHHPQPGTVDRVGWLVARHFQPDLPCAPPGVGVAQQRALEGVGQVRLVDGLFHEAFDQQVRKHDLAGVYGVVTAVSHRWTPTRPLAGRAIQACPTRPTWQ